MDKKEKEDLRHGNDEMVDNRHFDERGKERKKEDHEYDRALPRIREQNDREELHLEHEHRKIPDEPENFK